MRTHTSTHASGGWDVAPLVHSTSATALLFSLSCCEPPRAKGTGACVQSKPLFKLSQLSSLVCFCHPLKIPIFARCCILLSHHFSSLCSYIQVSNQKGSMYTACTDIYPQSPHLKSLKPHPQPSFYPSHPFRQYLLPRALLFQQLQWQPRPRPLRGAIPTFSISIRAPSSCHSPPLP